MGQRSSRIVPRSASNGIIITFDALGTLFNFKEPVAQQYLNVARKSGLTQHIDVDALEKAFRSSYKSYVSKYPNYGRGQLASPEVWWTGLVENTFGQLVARSHIPEGLGSKLHDHFSSSDAYTVYADVKPFLDTMKTIRKQYSGANQRSLIIGVITNSDPRVRNVLQSFDFRVGNTLLPSLSSINPIADQGFPWRDAWNLENDFDFLTTSYECGAEKPSTRVFVDASRRVGLVETSKAQQDLKLTVDMAGLKHAMTSLPLLTKSLDKIGIMQWIHIGDEVVKDYQCAKNAGLEALLIDRDGVHEGRQGRVESLEEVATVVKLMVQEAFQGE